MEDKIYCEACQDLREKDPNLVANGFTDHNCESLSHDLGLNFDGDVTEYNEHTWDTDDDSVRNKDCEDLNMLNDCLIGSMADEAEVTDQCAWRDYMKTFGANLWTMFKSLICAICGIWDNIWQIWINIHEIWDNIHKLWCIVKFIDEDGVELEIGEEESSSKNSYVVAGRGVSFLKPDVGVVNPVDVALVYVGGGYLWVSGSLSFYRDDFTEPNSKPVWNLDNGYSDMWSPYRAGNSEWGNTTGIAKTMVGGGELLFEIRIKKSAYPQIKKLFNGSAHPTGGGMYQVNLAVFDGDDPDSCFAYGQHGRCNTKTGEAGGSGYNVGHRVKQGYLYVQARMVSIAYMSEREGVQYTPRGTMGIQFNTKDIDC